jgi:hypothetical protein
MPFDPRLRDRLCELEPPNPLLRERYAKELQAMLEKKLILPMKVFLALVTAASIAIAIFLGTAALIHGELRFLARVGLAGGEIFALAWGSPGTGGLRLEKNCPLTHGPNVIQARPTMTTSLRGWSRRSVPSVYKIENRREIMNEFVFLYRGGERPTSHELSQQVLQKWMAWFKDLADKGHVVDRGQPLERSGKVVRGGGKSVIDGPFAETKDVVGGYTLIRANDLAQAVELAKGCPILQRGGDVEVRPVMKLDM